MNGGGGFDHTGRLELTREVAMNAMRILLTEDDPDHQDLIIWSLKRGRPDMKITVASTRAQFLDALKRDEFDCVIFDYNLPPYTAMDLIADLDELHKSMPRVVISSSEEQRIVVDSMRSGVDDFVHKDDAADGKTLWARVEAAMRTHAMRHDDRRVLCRRLENLEHKANHDRLTELLNRTGLEAALDPRGKASERRETLGLIFVDLDHFKRVNDTLGHQAGDDVLKAAADTIADLIDPTDIAGRWGGEEFLILRQSIDLAEAWAFADDLRIAIAERVKLTEELGKQTASLGVEVTRAGEDSKDAVKRADRAMYLAKELGRDRVCTTPMVRAYEAAVDIQATCAGSPRERVRRLREQLRGELGAVQLEHVGSHGDHVRRLSMLVGAAIFAGAHSLRDLEVAAEFHDIGKVGVPEALLALPRSLSPRERRFIDEHTRFGADLMRVCGAAQPVVQGVLNHHVRHDHTARTPDESEAPTNAEIISACDAAVTMLSDRPYSPARPVTRMLAEMERESGKQFHPRVVSALRELSARRGVSG